MYKGLLYVISPNQYKNEEIVQLIKEHPEIQYVSLAGIDFAGNDTDEKIPISAFLNDMDSFFSGAAVQTDGSSVVLHGIATLNNGKVDLVADPDVKWVIDYNWQNIDPILNKPVGSLRIPAFLRHDNKMVDSRSILKNTLAYVKKELIELLNAQDSLAGLEHMAGKKIVDISFSVGTELEFWVQTPTEKAVIDVLSASQVMKEQYWQRTKGEVRTAMEQSIKALELYELEPEMGHKEVGGIKAKINSDGSLSHVMEQLEIDWRFTEGLQAADNELLARQLVKEVFRRNGLEVTFQAKPINGVAGNGEHTHLGLAAKLDSGETVNLFTPTNRSEDYISGIGYGAIMGLLKHYEVLNPFISSTNDSFNRLKPGFEAPICIVTSLGHTADAPSRTRTILVGLVRDLDSPRSYRVELRSPNPFSNTYFVVAASYLTMLDGIKYAVESKKSLKELEKELSKEAGVEVDYLETHRAYRSEEDVFDDFAPEDRDRLFGKPPATVWENMEALKMYPEKVENLGKGDILTTKTISAFVQGALTRWKTEILTSLIPQGLEIVRECKKMHDSSTATDLDLQLWDRIEELRLYLAKDSIQQKSLLTRLKIALQDKEYSLASDLQQEMASAIQTLKDLYENQYCRNIL